MRQHEAAATRAVRAARRKHGKKPPHRALLPMTLASAGFLMVLTSLPPEEATPERVMAIYRLRWQIELAFKRLKSGLGIHRLVARDPVMARSWLLAHLILALLIEDATGEVLDFLPVSHANPHRPVSLWRLHGILPSGLIGAVSAGLRGRGLGTGSIHGLAPSVRPTPAPTKPGERSTARDVRSRNP